MKKNLCVCLFAFLAGFAVVWADETKQDQLIQRPDLLRKNFVLNERLPLNPTFKPSNQDQDDNVTEFQVNYDGFTFQAGHRLAKAGYYGNDDALFTCNLRFDPPGYGVVDIYGGVAYETLAPENVQDLQTKAESKKAKLMEKFLKSLPSGTQLHVQSAREKICRSGCINSLDIEFAPLSDGSKPKMECGNKTGKGRILAETFKHIFGSQISIQE